jgi:DNA-binding response OmpR family regulator
MKVLIAENNHVILGQLSDLLEKEGYETRKASDGQTALDLYNTDKPDFVLLDIEMGEVSGYDVCREIRKQDARIPIIFITSKTATFDKVVGLDLGADDYLVKPIDLLEVKARIRAVARRCLANNDERTVESGFRMNDVLVYPRQLRAEREGKAVDLNLRDIKILSMFYARRGEVIDRDTLLDYCWGKHISTESRTVDWHISQLRKKIESDPENPAIIKTVHGAGYKYEGTA